MLSLELAKNALPQMDMYPWTVIHFIDENSPFYKTEWKGECIRRTFIL